MVVGAEGDGVIQPGDRTAPGRCTAGPVVGNVAFTAAHCTVDRIDGRRLERLGIELDAGDGGSTGLDAQWFTSDAELSDTITTDSGDVEVVGVLRPWPGMRVTKTGWVSGVTAGLVVDGPDGLLGGSWVQGMKVCHGDSGSVAYAEVGPHRDVYIVGMVTNGNGGTNRVTGEEEPNGTCSEFPPLTADGATDYWGGIRRIEALCAAAGLVDCVEAAGRVFGEITSVVGSEDAAIVEAWAFDATDTKQPVVLAASIDGGPPVMTAVSDRRVKTVVDYSITPDVPVAASIVIPAEPGQHTVCVTAIDNGPGSDLDLGCRSVRVGVRVPGLPGHQPAGVAARWRQGPWSAQSG